VFAGEHGKRESFDIDPHPGSTGGLQRHHHRAHRLELFRRHRRAGIARSALGGCLRGGPPRCGAFTTACDGSIAVAGVPALIAPRPAIVARGMIGMSSRALRIAESWSTGQVRTNAHRGSALGRLQRRGNISDGHGQPGVPGSPIRRGPPLLVAAVLVTCASIPLLLVTTEPAKPHDEASPFRPGSSRCQPGGFVRGAE